MLNLEIATLKLSNKLGNRLNKTDEEKEIMNYGLFIILHTTISIVMTVLVGIVTGFALEMVIISITSSGLKRYSGGVHATTPERCMIIGIMVSFILSIACRFFNKSLSVTMIFELIILVFIIASFILYNKCPVSSKNKPLKKDTTRKKLRKKCFKIMLLYFLSTMFLYKLLAINNVQNLKVMIICILLGITLQIFSLTKLGEKVILFLDKIFNLMEKVK